MLPSPFLLPSLCHRRLLFIWNIALLCLLHIHTLTAIKWVSLKQGSHTQIPRSQQHYVNEWSKPGVCILNARLLTSTKKYTLPLLGTYDRSSSSYLLPPSSFPSSCHSLPSSFLLFSSKSLNSLNLQFSLQIHEANISMWTFSQVCTIF